MKISNPQQLVKSLDKKTFAKIVDQFGGIERFLSPGDKFRFTCDKSGTCCKNRYDSPIILTPYDAYRIQKGLKIGFDEFTSRYANKTLGSESQLPLLLMKFPKDGKDQDRCVFLDSSECNIYEDRPTVCRMYPVGRFSDKKEQSYYFLTETSKLCQFGKGKEYSLEEWLEKSDVKPYLKWNDKYNSVLLNMDHKKYKNKNYGHKCMFGSMLYDFDFIDKTCEGERPVELNRKGKDARLFNNYYLVKHYAKKSFS